jgi:predicted ferric reductase
LGLLCILPIIRGPFYELFSYLHYALALIATFALWRHLAIRKAFTHIYLVIAAAILVGTTLLRWISNIIRNLVYGKRLARAYISHAIGNAIEVHITLPRPWKARAGQYIYLCLPGVGHSFFQSHPFMVTWWFSDITGNASQIVLLIEPKSGFTAELQRFQKSEPLLAWIDGPYGQQKGISDYGSVVMFATGIGIAAHMPYLKELIHGRQECRARTGRISLVWQLDKESDEDWVKKWMDDLLEADSSYVR